MDNKYLPIGTVCTLRTGNKKMMIVGYSYPVFNGQLETCDYVGVPYPEGMLLPNQITPFQINDVSNVEFVGFTNDEYRSFRGQMVGNNVADVVNTSSRFEFDSNGVVIHDYSVENSEQTPAVTQRTYEFDENGVVIFDPAVELAVREDVDDKSYRYDARDEVESNNDKGTPAVENAAVETPKPSFQFDANGIVIEDMTSQIEEEYNEQVVPRFQFDENGIVVAEFA